MEKIINQILELDNQGWAKFLVVQISPNKNNKVLYQSKQLIFQPLNEEFQPSDKELIELNNFLVKEILCAKHIIPTFKNYFNNEINLIIPNELQSTTQQSTELKLYPTSDGKYWINDNLLKGFKEELLDKLKQDLAKETITNLNFNELVINNESYKIRSGFKDLEIPVSHIDVKYRLTTVKKSASDILVRLINNLKLKVVYIWSLQDLLSFEINQQKILTAQNDHQSLIFDWEDDCVWITANYFTNREAFKINYGINAIFSELNKLLQITNLNNEFLKNYFFNKLNLTNNLFDELAVLKLKSNHNNLNIFKLKDLKIKLVEAYFNVLKLIDEELHFKYAVKNLENYKFFHFGKINGFINFQAYLKKVLVDQEDYLVNNMICSSMNVNLISSTYHYEYEHLYTFAEWIKTRMEKSLLEQTQQILSTTVYRQETLLNNQYRSRVNYNTQKYTTFNKKVEK